MARSSSRQRTVSLMSFWSMDCCEETNGQESVYPPDTYVFTMKDDGTRKARFVAGGHICTSGGNPDRAYVDCGCLHSPQRGEIYIELPPNSEAQDDEVGLLTGMIAWTRNLRGDGWTRTVSANNLFMKEGMMMMMILHVDDFLVAVHPNFDCAFDFTQPGKILLKWK